MKPSPKIIITPGKDTAELIVDGQSQIIPKQQSFWQGLQQVSTPILPRTVRAMVPIYDGVLAVVQLPPQVVPFYTTPRQLYLSFPYIVLLLPFGQQRYGRPWLLEDDLSMFFSTQPLTSLNSSLLYASYVSQASTGSSHWICLGHQMEELGSKSHNPAIYIPKTIDYMVRRVYGSSSHVHVDDDLGRYAFQNTNSMTYQMWADLTKKDPLAGLKMPWRKESRHTLAEHIDNKFGAGCRSCDAVTLESFVRGLWNTKGVKDDDEAEQDEPYNTDDDYWDDDEWR